MSLRHIQTPYNQRTHAPENATGNAARFRELHSPEKKNGSKCKKLIRLPLCLLLADSKLLDERAVAFKICALNILQQLAARTDNL